MKISVFYEHIAEAISQTGKSLSDILTLIKSNGIDAVEIEAARLLDKEEDLYQKLREAGISISCICSFFDFRNQQDVKAGYGLIDLAEKVGSKRVLIIPGFLKAEDNRETVISSMKEAVRAICSYAEGKGIVVTMEDFDDSMAPYSTTQGLYSFLKEIPGLACAFDTGNFLYSEDDAEEALTLMMPYIRHIHLKDRSLQIKKGEQPKLTISCRELYSSAVGEGCIPMKNICQRLIQNGYNETLAIEHFGSQTQLEDMIKSAKWIKKNWIH